MATKIFAGKQYDGCRGLKRQQKQAKSLSLRDRRKFYATVHNSTAERQKIGLKYYPSQSANLKAPNSRVWKKRRNRAVKKRESILEHVLKNKKRRLGKTVRPKADRPASTGSGEPKCATHQTGPRPRRRWSTKNVFEMQ